MKARISFGIRHSQFGHFCPIAMPLPHHNAPREVSLDTIRLVVREEIAPLHAAVAKNSDDITALKARASLWGAVTGALTTLGLSLLAHWQKP